MADTIWSDPIIGKLLGRQPNDNENLIEVMWECIVKLAHEVLDD